MRYVLKITICKSYGRKSDKRIVLSYNMISWESIDIILAFFNHCIFSHAFIDTSSFSGRSAVITEERMMNTEKRIKRKFLVWFKETPSQALDVPVYGDNIMWRSRVFQWHKDSKLVARRWKMIPGAGDLQQAGDRRLVVWMTTNQQVMKKENISSVIWDGESLR